MIILDENIDRPQRDLLSERRIAFRHISSDLGRPGMSDEEIIPLLHGLNYPTFFTQDEDYYDRQLCHAGYCLIQLGIEPDELAQYIRRVLKHPALDTRAKRMGLVLRASPRGLTGWRLQPQTIIHLPW